MSTTRIFATAIACLCLLTAISFADDATPPAPATQPAAKDQLPAEGMELTLPGQLPPEQVFVSPGGHYAMAVGDAPQGRFREKGPMNPVVFFNADTGDTIQLSNLWPAYTEFDGKKTGPRLVGVTAEGKGLILLITFAESVGVNLPARQRVLCVDIANKKVLLDKQLDELSNRFVSIICQHSGDEWFLSFLAKEDMVGTLILNADTGATRRRCIRSALKIMLQYPSSRYRQETNPPRGGRL